EHDLRAALAELVAEAADGDVTAADALAGRAPLPVLGMTSLAYVRLIDAVEERFGITLDLEGDLSYLDSVDALAARLIAAGVPAGG
ncbi:MAG TPA: acyl carrier protein, partial [Pilimelia sp.]|nr:acyl carrier protein [Pilimelia sp.]